MSNEIRPNSIWKLKEYDEHDESYIIVISKTIEGENEGWDELTEVVNYMNLKDSVVDYYRTESFLHWYEYVQ